MDNVTATVGDDDFDALLEASSLGAPRVIAAIGTAPPDARRRFDHAARHPQTCSNEITTTTYANTRPQDHRAPAHHAPALESRPTLLTTPVGATGTGKTAAYPQFIHSAYSAMSALRGEAVKPPRVFLVVPRTRELLHAALCADGQANPWPAFTHECLTALLARRPEVPAAPLCIADLLRARTTLRHEAGARFAQPGSPAFAAPCDGFMPRLVTTRDLQGVTSSLQRGVLDAARSWNSVIALRETRHRVLPLCVTDDLIDAGLWTNDACVLREEPWLLDRYARTQAAFAALRRLAGDPLLRIDAQRQPELPTLPAGSVHHGKSVMAAAYLASSGLADDVLLTRVLSMAHHEDAQPRRQGLEQLLHWWTLRAAHAQDWRQVLDGDCHQQRPEHLWSKVARFLPPAVELRCPDEPWKPQTTLWTPTLGQPRSRRMTVGGSTSVEGRPERTREGALIGTQTVRAEITGKLHLSTPVGTLPLPTRFNYRSDDPYAVETVFAHGGMSVSWTFARDLLTDGMQARAGDGDVRVWPRTSTSDGAQIFIELSPPAGTALVSLPRSSVEEFLNQTTSIVPTGAEHAYLSPTLYELERKLNQLTTHPGSGE